MALTITRRDIDKAHALAKRARDAAERNREKGEYIMGQVSQSLEVGAGALGFGVLAGRFGQVSLGPVPLDLLTGLGLHGLAFLGAAGKYSEHLHNFGDGVLASYLVKLGAGLGTQMRINAGQSPFVSGGSRGAFGVGAMNMNGGQCITESELAAMAQALR